ncbi:MAG: hypothetical protein IJS65_04250 [Clostridia bacterium]|nr:hypothetical protein [Clostridia bacterium]
MKLYADFTKAIRPVGELNGVNNGPLLTYTDRSAEYRDLGVKFVRFHDTCLDAANCIDVPFIFRDGDADENDPSNYYFGATDAIIKAAHDEGIEIMYRVGASSESVPRIFLKIPTDYQKWARIVEHIIMHYNEGWANGFHYGIKYFEIWNEADLKSFWSKGPFHYINFYSQVSNYLKKRFPDIKIGPCGFADLFETDERFITDRKKHETHLKLYGQLFSRFVAGEYPMDFFPWHEYGPDSAKFRRRCDAVKILLSRYGLCGKLEVINTEWGLLSLKRDDRGQWDFSQIYEHKKAVALLNTMLIMQKSGVSKAAYYHPDERTRFCGVYDFGGVIRNHYYALKAFNMLKQAKAEVETRGGDDEVRVCAATDGQRAVIIIGNESERGRRIELSVKGLSDLSCSRYVFSGKEKLKKHADMLKPRFVIPGATAFIYVFGQEDER